MKFEYRYRQIVHEIEHWRRLRRLVLRAELMVRNVPHTVGGDAILVHVDGLWFDVIPWMRDGWALTWLVDHPHVVLDDQHPTWDIGSQTGFRFDIGRLPAMWRQYQAL
ncbi:hypothetical protein [Nocardia carnea]|uniref:hypothetical protein n=1 Tax=Nocardia carnea TaxID=37328 RepID=UPI0024554141|nr:hypothetical protein [Nocardia carnea]